jgi:hypothetical protein
VTGCFRKFIIRSWRFAPRACHKSDCRVLVVQSLALGEEHFGRLHGRLLSAAAATRNWVTLIPSAAASFSSACFSDTGRRNENVVTFVLTFESSTTLPPA